MLYNNGNLVHVQAEHPTVQNILLIEAVFTDSSMAVDPCWTNSPPPAYPGL